MSNGAESMELRCELKNVTEPRLRRSIGIRFVVFLVQGRIFKLVADGHASDSTALTRDRSSIPFGSNKFAWGWMKIGRDGKFAVNMKYYEGVMEATALPLPDMRPLLMFRLKELGIDTE